MKQWIKNGNKYFYVKYDNQNETMRKSYLYHHMKRYDEIIAFNFVQQPKRVLNTDFVVEKMMSKLSIDDEVRHIVKKDFKIIPINHL
ncbi:MAG: hypothetical protein LUG12_00810 [Erysipelotrichaceae bacterium]|nr:hypothetical protein [Erysipelotrichaceae bacterium]